MDQLEGGPYLYSEGGSSRKEGLATMRMLKHHFWATLLMATSVRLTSSHAYLIAPEPRVTEALQPPRNNPDLAFGLKRITGTTPFSLAVVRQVTDQLTSPMAGCGPSKANLIQNLDGAAETNVETSVPGIMKTNYTAGQRITVQWKLPIPHREDNQDLGVRVAIVYPPADGAAESTMVVLAGAPRDGLRVLPGSLATVSAAAGTTSSLNGEVQSYQVTLPEKSCARCVLQWLWVATNDEGYYLDCADISIKAREDKSFLGFESNVVAGGTIGLLLVVALVATAFYSVRQREVASGTVQQVSLTPRLLLPTLIPKQTAAGKLHRLEARGLFHKKERARARAGSSISKASEHCLSCLAD